MSEKKKAVIVLEQQFRIKQLREIMKLEIIVKLVNQQKKVNIKNKEGM